MKRLHSLIALMLLLGVAHAAGAADLAKIERAVGKEPAYRGKPKYGLLVFGPEAKTRVWVVIDGDRLYVDRNGNGDLTEAGECLHSSETHDWGPAGVWQIFRADKLAADPKTASDLYAEVKGAFCFFSSGNHYAGGQHQDKIELADHPKDAPVVHFNGPMSMGASGLVKLGDQVYLNIFVGTPGIGPNTCAKYRIDKPIALPKVELVFPHRTAGQPPIRIPVRDLEAGCCGDAFYFGKAPPPANAGAGNVKIEMSFADYPHGKVAPATVELPLKTSR